MIAQPSVRRRRLLWWLAWIIATVCLVVFLRFFDVRAAVAHMAHAHPAWLIAAILANFAVLPVVTEIWARLLPSTRPIRWRVLWDCVTLSIAAMNVLPFGGGHAVAVGVIASRSKSGMPGAVSLLALEGLCDGFAKLVVLLVAIAVAPLPPLLQQAGWVLTATMLAGFGVIVWVAKHPAGKGQAHGWRASWSRHLEAIRRPRVLIAATALTVVTKLFALLAVYAVQRSLGIELPLATGPLVLAAVTFATIVSVSPGNLGVYEAAAFGAYRLLGVPAGEAAALGVVQHACLLIPLVGTGYALTLWRMMFPAPATSG